MTPTDATLRVMRAALEQRSTLVRLLTVEAEVKRETHQRRRRAIVVLHGYRQWTVGSRVAALSDRRMMVVRTINVRPNRLAPTDPAESYTADWVVGTYVGKVWAFVQGPPFTIIYRFVTQGHPLHMMAKRSVSMESLPDEVLEFIMGSITAPAPHPVPPRSPTPRPRLTDTAEVLRTSRVCRAFQRVARRPDCHKIIFINRSERFHDSALRSLIDLAAGSITQISIHQAPKLTTVALARICDCKRLCHLFVQSCRGITSIDALHFPKALDRLSVLDSGVDAATMRIVSETLGPAVTLDVAVCPSCDRVESSRAVHACNVCGTRGCSKCTHKRCSVCSVALGCTQCLSGRHACSTPYCDSVLCTDCTEEDAGGHYACDDCGDAHCHQCIHSRLNAGGYAVPCECRGSSFVAATGRCYRSKMHRFDRHREWWWGVRVI